MLVSSRFGMRLMLPECGGGLLRRKAFEFANGLLFTRGCVVGQLKDHQVSDLPIINALAPGPSLKP